MFVLIKGLEMIPRIHWWNPKPYSWSKQQHLWLDLWERPLKPGSETLFRFFANKKENGKNKCLRRSILRAYKGDVPVRVIRREHEGD